MSESTITITATFPDSSTAQKIENIMNELAEVDDMSFEEFLESKELTKGMTFCDSWWVPVQIKRNDKVLHLELIGSPSGYLEEDPDRIDDSIEWLKLFGAKNITGKLLISPGSDVEVVEF
jgi:hypothetical protein